MKLGIIKTIIREELARFEKLPPWMDSFLQTLNQFISNVGTALNGNLDFRNNFLCTVKSITLTHGVEQQINPNNTKLRVIGVACFNAGGKIVDKFGWVALSNGNIGVTIYFDGGTSSTESTCELILFLGA